VHVTIRAAAIAVLGVACGCSASSDADEDPRSSTAGSGGEASGTGASSSSGAGGDSSSSSDASSSTASTGGAGGGGGETGVPFQMTDPLTGSTMGNVVGGSLGPDGWTVTDRTDRLWWALPRLVEGSVEFTVTNLTLANLTVNDNEVLAIYDGGWGIAEPIAYNPEYRNNYYKGMIRIYGTNEPERTGQQKTIWFMCPAGSPGYGDGEPCPCASNFGEETYNGDPSWDGSPQVLRIAWAAGKTTLYRNGAEVHTLDWSGSGVTFGPSELHVSLGTSRSTAVDTAGMPVGAVFSNMVIEGITGPETPACQ
jgi:hypothetical protein